MPLPRFRAPLRATRWALGTVSTLLIAGAAAMIGRTVQDALHPPRATRLTAAVVPLRRHSQECRDCHAAEFAAWSGSDHARAQRSVGTEDRTAFTPARSFTLGGVAYQVAWHDGKPAFEENDSGGHVAYTADFVLGHQPLRQYLVPAGHGRYQAAALAYDPARQEWFDVFGGDRRHPGDWGHWQGRGLNWNSMCAHCHLTEFSKRYDPATDGYASTWLEQGVGCVQCHDGLTSDHASPGYRTAPTRRQRVRDHEWTEQTCAPCHARDELLTGEPRPGWSYDDHFRVALPTDPAVFYPDGQVREEDFNWTSFLISRMGGKAGVTCLDCHDPHSGRTRLPVADNQLCLQCHAANNGRGAPAIDPLAHSHHQVGSAGNACVACHMPPTTYMQRDPRHDHGFLRPDPLLTKELGIPNACDRCHADKGVAWQIVAADRWYGAAMDSRQRARARAIAAIQRGEASAAKRVLAMLADEDIPAWRATLLQLLRGEANAPEVVAAARRALADPAALVRSAAVQVLAANPATAATLRDQLHDPVRLVRLDAAFALSPELPADGAARRELDAYERIAADQPVGELRIADDRMRAGDLAGAAAAAAKAVAWDPNSGPAYEMLALIADRQGRTADAAKAYGRAMELEPGNAGVAFNAGLEFAAAGEAKQAIGALREAVRRDPDFDRAWYNLGLALAQAGDVAGALTALARAEALAPSSAEYAYARATVLWQEGRQEEARAEAQRALSADPTHAGARAMLAAP